MTTPDYTWLTVPEAARELRISVSTAWRWIRSGRLPATRMGTRVVRVRRDHVRSMPQAGEATSDPDGISIMTGDRFRPFKEVLAQLKRHREAMLAERGGVPLSDSVEVLRQVREERYNDL